MTADNYVVGVDGGATKTTALFGTAEGRVLGRGTAGSANYHNVGPTIASYSIRNATARAQKKARLSDITPTVAVVALAAVDSSKDRRVASQFVHRTKIAEKTFVIHDTVAALCAATRGASGIIVNSGTGSVAAGINKSGKYVRVGGWGYLVDDEGSGYDIGRNALTTVFRTWDGRISRTNLTKVLKKRFRTNSLGDILNAIYTKNWGVQEIASLAPLVSAAAETDRVCRDILKQAGLSLAEIVVTTARRLEMTRSQFPVFTVGGNFKSGRFLLAPFTSKVKDGCPRAQIRSLEVEPAIGVLWLAAKLASPDSPESSVARRLAGDLSPK
jgi:N-acetylglucosamine kinase-like BadF-type ATPase